VPSSLQLALGLYTHKLPNQRSLLPLGIIVRRLLKMDARDTALKLLLRMAGPADDGESADVSKQQQQLFLLTVP